LSIITPPLYGGPQTLPNKLGTRAQEVQSINCGLTSNCKMISYASTALAEKSNP
jgi:hypothetical protein